MLYLDNRDNLKNSILNKKSNLIYLLCGIFTLILISSCMTNKPKIDEKTTQKEKQHFTNKSRIPLISNCKDNHTNACLQNTISDLILNEAKNRNLTLKTDTLKVGIRFNKDGSVSILNNETKNVELKNVTTAVLNKMELIEPAYIESLNRYETVSYSWYIFIENNRMTNRFENR